LATQYSPNGAFIAVVFDDPLEDESRQTVQIFNAETGNITHNSGNSVPLVTSITFSPDSKRVFVSFSGRYRNKDDSGGIVEIETATGKFNDQSTDGISVHCAMVSPKTEQVFAGLGDRTLERWEKIVSLADSQTPNILPAKLPGTPLHFAPAPSRSTFAVLFRDSATGDDEATNTWVQFWNFPSGTARCDLRPTPPQKANVSHSDSQEPEVVADTSRDGRRILKLKSNLVTICDAKTGRQIGAQIHLQADYGGFFGIQTAKFSPDGTLFATGEGGDFRIGKGFARIWDASTGNPLSAPLVHHSAVTFVSFSEDGKRLVTIETNLPKDNLRNIRVWDVRTGLPLTEVMRSKVASESAQFNRERDQLTGSSPGEAGSEGVAEMWDIGFPSSERPPDWFPRLAEIAGGFQLNSETGALEPLPDRWSELEALRNKLSASTEKIRFTLFGKWLLADPFERTVSPFAKMTIPEYVEWCLARGEDNLADEAQAVAAGNEALMAKVAAKRSP
jgi:WD40 repeat protein